MNFLSAKYFLLQAENQNGFQTFAGLRTKSFAVSARPRPQLGFSPSRWQKLRGASGPLSVQLNGTGLFSDAARDLLFGHYLQTEEGLNMRVLLPEIGNFTGPFLLTELACQGQEEDLLTWRMAVQSAGDISFEMA